MRKNRVGLVELTGSCTAALVGSAGASSNRCQVPVLRLLVLRMARRGLCSSCRWHAMA